MIDGMFISPKEQIACVRGWNKIFGWDLTEDDFTKANASVPAWPHKALCAVVLDITFGGANYLSSVKQTLWKNWELLRWLYKDKDNMIHKFHIEEIELLPGTVKIPGLQWRTINLAANCHKYSQKYGWKDFAETRMPNVSASSEVLWSAAYFPEWAKMLGKELYEVAIAGYKFFNKYKFINVSGRSDGSTIDISPRISFYGEKTYVPEVIQE